MTPALATLLWEHVFGIRAWPFTGAWLALYTTTVYDPTTATVGTEVTGGGYARVELSVSLSDLAALSDTSCSFPEMPGVSVSGVGIHNDPVAGDLLLYAHYETPVTVNVGQRFVVAAGDLLAEVVAA